MNPIKMDDGDLPRSTEITVAKSNHSGKVSVVFKDPGDTVTAWLDEPHLAAFIENLQKARAGVFGAPEVPSRDSDTRIEKAIRTLEHSQRALEKAWREHDYDLLEYHKWRELIESRLTVHDRALSKAEPEKTGTYRDALASASAEATRLLPLIGRSATRSFITREAEALARAFNKRTSDVFNELWDLVYA